MEKITDGQLTIVAAGPAGNFGNNVYVIVDSATNEAAFVDAPGNGDENVAAAEFAGVRPSKILLTHSHGDHTASVERLKELYGCRLYGDEAEPWLQPGQLDVPVKHDETVMVGSLTLRVLSVPGHTPGSTTYVHGKHAFVGDTLFPGGPGRTQTNADLQREIASITGRLYRLPDDTIVYTGHGDRTTIGASKAEYAVFAANEHAPDLHGDVTWEGS